MSQQRMIFVKPAADSTVVNEDGTKTLAPEGEWRPYNVFWATRLLHGDVTECAAPANVPPPVIELPPQADPPESDALIVKQRSNRKSNS